MINARQRRYIKRFERAGAIEEKNSKSLDELGLIDSSAFQSMIRRGIFIEMGNGLYYLNLPILEVMRNSSRYFLRIGFFILAIAALAVILGILS